MDAVTHIDPDLKRTMNKRVTRLALSLATQLQPGYAYTVTVIVPDAHTEPIWSIASAGKLQNLRNFRYAGDRGG